MNTKALTLILFLATALAAPAAFAGHSKYRRYSNYSSPSYTTLSRGSYTSRRVRSERAGEYDYAEVVAVEPLVRVVTVTVPRRECWDEEVYRRDNYRHRGHGGTVGATIAGGLIGGVIGRQIGGGSGRDAMTVVGTLVGSAIANERARERAEARGRDSYDRGYYDTVRRCETRDEVREEERIDGYRVTYLYNGRKYTTRTDRDPGERIRVRVSVSPVTRS